MMVTKTRAFWLLAALWTGWLVPQQGLAVVALPGTKLSSPAHNLHSRTNGGLAQTFATDAANQLTAVNRNGTFTFSGATPAPATNVWVNGQPAQVYRDFTFARTNLTLADGANPFTINATNLYRVATNSTMTVNLPQQVTLAYDNDGNLTNDGVRSFAYDWEDQLTNVFVPKQWRSDFVYDGLNRRRVELDYAWTNAAWLKTNEIHYVYDGFLLIQERDVSNNVLVTYTRGLDMSGGLSGAGGIGGLLARTDNSGSTYYHTDGSGNITALMDASENVVARYLYSPYGKLLGQWGTITAANEMQFASMPRHGYSGLSLYAFRAYDPNLQRWLNRDPIGERGGLNLYRFVGNNPVNWVDPFGLAQGYGNGVYGAGGASAGPSSYYSGSVSGPNGQFYNSDLGPGTISMWQAPYEPGLDNLNDIRSYQPDPPWDPFASFYNGRISDLSENAVQLYLAATGIGELADTGLGLMKTLAKKCPSSMPIPENLPHFINKPRQALHAPETASPGRSILTKDPQGLLDGVLTGKYPIIRYNPRGQPVVDFGENIGTYTYPIWHIAFWREWCSYCSSKSRSILNNEKRNKAARLVNIVDLAVTFGGNISKYSSDRGVLFRRKEPQASLLLRPAAYSL